MFRLRPKVFRFLTKSERDCQEEMPAYDGDQESRMARQSKRWEKDELKRSWIDERVDLVLIGTLGGEMQNLSFMFF